MPITSKLDEVLALPEDDAVKAIAKEAIAECGNATWGSPHARLVLKWLATQLGMAEPDAELLCNVAMMRGMIGNASQCCQWLRDEGLLPESTKKRATASGLADAVKAWKAAKAPAAPAPDAPPAPPTP